MQTITYKLDITPGGVPLTIHISQYDVGLRQYTFEPYTTVGSFSYVAGATVTLEATKPDGYAVIHSCEYNQDGSITYTLQEQLAAKAGSVWSKVVIRNGNDVLGTGAVVWMVDNAGVKDNAIISESDIPAIQAAASSASLAQAAATQAAGYVDQAVILGGTPLVAATVSAMSDHDRVYVYTGSETGYTAGNWYYWNGSAWTSGGIYNSSAVQTDPTLSISGMAADAAATGELKNGLIASTGNSVIQWTDGKYIALNGTTANINNPTTSSAWRYAVVNCSEGDQFTINARGRGTPRLWGFINSSGTILSVAASNTTGANLIITAPANAVKLVLNDTDKTGVSYVGNLLVNRVDTAETVLGFLTDENRISFSVSANGGQYWELPVASGETVEFDLLSAVGNFQYVQAYLFKSNGTYTQFYNYNGENKWYPGDKATLKAADTYDRFRCYVFVESGTVTISFAAYKVDSTTYTERIKSLEGRGLLNRTTCKVFKKVVCCGDSYTSGHINKSGGTQYPSNPEFAWPHYMETMTGNTWVNCGVSGANSLTWQTNPNGLAKAQAAGKAQAYVIGLGLNDEASDTDRYVPVGTAADIGTSAQTYYGGISAIIRALAAISPDAFIFVNTNPNTNYNDLANHNAVEYNEALRTIVSTYEQSYNVHLIDLAKDYAYLYTNPSLSGSVVSRHYTATGYEQLAEIYAFILSDYIGKHIADFNEVALIDYE